MTRITPKEASSSTGAAQAAPEFEIDLDRLVYDPEYRRRVRDALNRPRSPARGPAPGERSD